jgi:hypothetical protein
LEIITQQAANSTHPTTTIALLDSQFFLFLAGPSSVSNFTARLSLWDAPNSDQALFILTAVVRFLESTVDGVFYSSPIEWIPSFCRSRRELLSNRRENLHKPSLKNFHNRKQVRNGT